MSVLPRRILEAGLWIAALGVPLAWSDRFYAEYVLPKFVILNLGVLIAALGFALGAAAGEFRVRRTVMDIPILGFGAALALACARSVDPILSAIGHYNEYTHGLWGLALFVSVYFLAVWGLEETGRRRLLAVSVAAAALVGAYAVLQALGFEPFPRVGRLPEGRAVSFIGSPVFLGAYLATAAPLALHIAVKGKCRRLWTLPALLFVCAGLIATVSRGAMLAGGLACAMYIWLGREKRPLRLSRAQRAAAVLLLGLLVLAAGSLVMKRSAASKAHGSPRVELWSMAWRSFLSHPLTGSGPDTFEIDFRRNRSAEMVRLRSVNEFQIHAHNDVMQILATMGIVGFAAYLAALAALLLLGWRIVGREERRGGVELASLAAVSALFIVVKFNPPHISALALGALCVGLCSAPGKRERCEGAGGIRSTAIACILLLCAMGSGWLAGRLTLADYYFKLALAHEKAGNHAPALENFQAAVRLNRCELEYRRTTVNHLITRAYDPAERRSATDMLDKAFAQARTARGCRPLDMHSHYIYGVAALMQAQAGRLDKLADAETALDEGLRLDPLFAPLARARERAARLRGDAVAAESYGQRAAYLESLFQG
ncbi:MAG: O-antigen ligase family protein [Elusimicrobiota bacterium]